jgi:hypothetical protein
MESEGLLPHSQVPVTCPYPEPARSGASHFLKILLSSTSGSSKWSLSLRFPHQNLIYTSPLPSKCYMSSPSHSTRFYHSNNIGWGEHIIRLLFIIFLRNGRHYLKQATTSPCRIRRQFTVCIFIQDILLHLRDKIKNMAVHSLLINKILCFTI